MSDIDEKILRAIKENRNGEQVPEDEASVLHLISRSFKSTFRYTAIFVILLQVIFAGLTVYSVYQMLTLTDPAAKIEWLAGVVIFFVTFGLLRIWLFMELNRLSVLREIKRVEMQIAYLADKL